MAYNKKKKMMEQVYTIVDRLSEVIGNMQKCLECTICLHTISDPVKTLCGHRFCRLCIQKVLQNKNAHCPLCNTAIHRRSITRDEHMVLYIDRLEKLIQSIELDSGIDILSHLPRPRGILEAHASDNIEHCKPDDTEEIKPSCSYDNTSLPRKQSVTHSNRSTQRQRSVYKRHTAKHKNEQKEGNSITKYLSKCTISGVEPLPPDESNDPLNEKSMEEKVSSWLENLPETDKFDDPNKNSSAQLEEFNLDDTLIASISQNCQSNKVETSQKDAEVAVVAIEESNSCRSMTKRSSRNSVRDEKNENKFNDKEERRRNSQTRTVERDETRMELDMEYPKPSTSSITKSGVDREKSQDRHSDVRRTSPGDLLPAMKKNWSSVKEFGKEMRTRKKKLKSLNVSIENKGRSRSLDEPAENINREEIIETEVTKNLNNGSRGKGMKTPEDVTIPPLDKEFFVAEKSSAANKGVLEENVSPRSRYNRSISEGVRMPGESYFITLEEGEQVRIRNLNTTQMNNIIGVAEHNDEPEDVEMDTKNSPKRKYEDLSSSTPLRNQFKKLPYATPEKSPLLQGRDNMCSGSNQTQADLSCTGTTFEGVTPPNRGRLSLKKRSVDQKSNDSFASNSDSRLQAIRRNLNPGLDQSMENVDERERRNVEGQGATDKSTDLGTNLGTDTENIRRVKDLPGVSNDLTDAKKEFKEHKRSLVTFRKLGKIYKHRKKCVTFTYLGSTSCEFFHCCPSLNKHKPCNPIDALGTQDFEGNFGNNAQITVDDTPAAKEAETSNMEAVKELEKSALKIQESPNNKQEIIEQSTSKTLVKIDNNIPVQSQESDVLLITLDENEQIFHLPITHPTKSPENTSIKSTVKMLSPTKDSQLQFLSLESPTIESFESQKMIERSELVKGDSFSEIRAQSRTLARASQQAACSSESPCTPQRKRKRSKSRDNLLHRMKKHSDDKNDDCLSNHSFCSQVTCVRNSSKEFLRIPKKNTTERCQSSSTKDLDNVSLSSDMDTLPDGETEQKKVYRRIVPLASSGTSSPDLISLNNSPNNQRATSPTTKRKRDVSPDSDVEADLNVIVSNWYEDAKPGDRYKKKGKLKGTRDTLNSMNASREARNNSSSGSCSNDRNRGANKLSEWQNRQSVDFLQNSSTKKSNFTEIERRQRLENRVELVVDDDSPDFGATIDKVKDIRDRGIFDGNREDLTAGNLLQDNFDEIIANVVTDSLIDNCCDGKGPNVKVEPVEFLEECQFNENIPKLKNDFVCASSNSSDKENAYQNLGPLYDINVDTDKTLTPEHESVSDENSRIDKSEKKIRTAQLTSKVESMSIESNKSMVHNSAAPVDKNELPINENVANDSMVKDTCEQDSLMNITQHYLMIKQFEEDLFGKPKSSNAVSEKEQRKQGHQTPQKKKKESLKTNAKDVEHSGEEDDIVENTPDTKTKTRGAQAIDSPKESPRVSSLSQLFERQFPNNSPASTCKKTSTGINTPACKRKIHPLYQSTPKTDRSICNSNYSAAKTISTINASFHRETRHVVRNDVETIRNTQSAQTSTAQRFCFVCSGLLPSQIDHVKKLSKMVNGKYVTQFDREVTHVIVKANKESNGADKTLKYLQGIAHRKWIVSYQWVVDSLKASSLINEEPYEAVDSTTLEAGPRKSRIREKNLFEGFVFLCIGPYDDVSVEQYQDLLSATGAIVVDSLDALAAEKKRLKIIVIQADVYNYEIIEWYKKARAIPIVHDWVIECISQHKLISFYPYLQELSRQDVLTLGYPEYLVEEEADGDSDSVYDESS